MIDRHIERRVREALADTPVVLIHGARQTGKTTLARSLAAGRQARRYLTLDDMTVLAAARADPAGFIAGLEGPVIIDEVQRAPDLLIAIKAEVDRVRTPGRFLLTGSANLMLLPKLSESLAGRMEIVTLWPLSQGEIEGRAESFVGALFASKFPAFVQTSKRQAALPDRIVRGGYPEPHARQSPDRRAAWYASYLTTILQRDIRDLASIEGLTDFPRLLSLAAARTSGLLNFADIARGLSLPQTTLKRYFTLLESTFLLATLPAWSGNLGLRLTKAPKILLTDTGLACHLLGIDAERLSADGNLRGPMLETFIALELLKQLGWSSSPARLMHFRTAAGREVDLVLEAPDARIAGVEVKSAGSVSSSDFAGLRALRDAAGTKFHRGVVLYDGAETVRFEKDLIAAPIAAVWA